MDDAIHRRLGGGAEPSDEPMEEASGMNNLGDQMVGGLAGVRALHDSGWDPPADLEWQDEQDEWHVTPTAKEETSRTGIDARTLALAAGIFLLAALPRLLVIFFATDLDNPGVGWYNDTFHHWQIGYLSKEIGFSEGFLRLWDFKGMEYFWGLLHPLLLAALFTLTGSIDILIPRLVSLVFGSASIALLYFLLRRHFNLHVALAGVLLGIVLPVAVFADAAGLLQPIAMFFLLLGFVLWPRHAVWAGLSWGLAGMVRAEYWIFGAGLLVISILADEKSEKKLALWAGWLVPSLAYMKYMLSHTGNAIYPVYWNFTGSIAGEWMGNRPLDTFQIGLQWISRVVLVVAIIAAIWIIRKRPKSYLFVLYGLGNIIFVASTFGLGAYIHGLLPRVLYARLMIVPYLSIAIFVAVLLLSVFPRGRFRKLQLASGWAIVVAFAALMQLAWTPILGYYEKGKDHWSAIKVMADEVASYYSGGTISIPEDRPLLTYALVRYQNIDARSLQGQMYDPFAYFADPKPFAKWEENRVAVANWLEGSDIRLIVYGSGKATYTELIEREGEWFDYLASPYGGLYEVYQVNRPLLD